MRVKLVRLGLDLGSGFRAWWHVGTGDWRLGLGLDNKQILEFKFRTTKAMFGPFSIAGRSRLLRLWTIWKIFIFFMKIFCPNFTK